MTHRIVVLFPRLLSYPEWIVFEFYSSSRPDILSLRRSKSPVSKNEPDSHNRYLSGCFVLSIRSWIHGAIMYFIVSDCSHTSFDRIKVLSTSVYSCLYLYFFYIIFFNLSKGKSRRSHYNRYNHYVLSHPEIIFEMAKLVNF